VSFLLAELTSTYLIWSIGIIANRKMGKNKGKSNEETDNKMAHTQTQPCRPSVTRRLKHDEKIHCKNNYPTCTSQHPKSGHRNADHLSRENSQHIIDYSRKLLSR
jgi:hypothetical protein